MQEITFDFRNRWILINTESQDTSEDMYELIQKQTIKEFVPSLQMYMNGDNFTLDFEKNTVRRNRSVEWGKETEYTRGMLVAEEELPYENLKFMWETVVERMGYQRIDYGMLDDYMDTISFLAGLNKK